MFVGDRTMASTSLAGAAAVVRLVHLSIRSSYDEVQLPHI